MMFKPHARLFATLAITSVLTAVTGANTALAESTTMAPVNPYLIQDSVYPSVHFDPAQTDATTLPIWPGSSTLDPSQVQWLPGLTTIGTAHLPYKGGEHAIFFSGGNRVGKIRVTDGVFQAIDEVAIPGWEGNTISTTRLRSINKRMEASLKDEASYLAALGEFLDETKQSGATLGNGVYTVMDRDGYFYAGWGTSVYKIGDVRTGDVFSPIEIVASFDLRDALPADQRDKISRIFGFAMTYDGHLAVAMPGIIAVMDRNLGNMQYILLEDEAVDNGISVDDKGGIYVVTSKYMRKVVWNGKKLSDDEADGAWKSEYDYVENPRAMSRGSGNTPTLMGFGPDEDKLVVVADAGSRISVIAFWRDEIPDGFKQKPGTKSRRIADQLPLTIDVPATIEWSAHVYGYGVMMMASAWPDPVKTDKGGVSIFETVMTAGITREAPVGAEKWSWDPKSDSFKSDWTVDYPLQWALHPVSAASGTVSLCAVEDGVYSLKHVDWASGRKVGEVVLGTNPIFNTAGGFYMPISEDLIYVSGIFGPVLLTRKNP